MRFILYFFLLVSAPVLADQDADFLAANDAFRAGNAVKLQQLAQRLKNTPLDVYVNYYQLRLDLNKAEPGAMIRFLSRPEDTPLIDQLRGEWLKLLGSRQQWELFDSEYPLLLNEDTELTCFILQSRLRNHDQTALREARALWFSSKGQPESCGVPFEAAISAGIISKQDINQRLRLALEAGNVSLAKQLFARLEGDQGVSAKALENAAADSLRYLDKLKLDDSKSMTVAPPATSRAKPVEVVEARASAGAIQNPPYRKWAADYPLLAGHSLDLEIPGMQHPAGGSGKISTPAQRGSATSDIYISPEYSFRYLQPADVPGWRADLANGCLNLTHVLSDSGSPVLVMQNGKSSESHVCPNPCRIFSISAIIVARHSGVDEAARRPSTSGLVLGGIDTMAVESLLAKIRQHYDEPTVSIPPLYQKRVPEFPSNGQGITASGTRPGWRSLLDKLGMDKADEPEISVTDGGSHVPSVCDPCTIASEASTVSPMEWNPKLAGEGQRAVVLFALQRLAKQSTDLAAKRWMKIAPYFPSPEQHYFYGRLAYEAARDLDDRALQWYKEAANTPLNEQQSAWRVRAALRTHDWPEVLSSVIAMSELQQREAVWRYWKARALQAMGKPVEARDLFAPLSSEYHFYGLLAGEELAGTPVLSQAVPAYKPDSQSIKEMLALPGVQRTLALYRMGLRNEALDEWRWLIRNFNDRELITAAEIARRNEMYDRAIGAADRTVSVHDFSLRYLAPYREVLQEHIREHGLEEAWVYGLMRQESRFVSSAKSGVGAAGLMQIMPATARWVANKLGLKSYRKSLIHQLDTNLRLGTYYMKSVLSQFDDSPVLASAAYNAGPRRAREWRGDKPLEGAIYTETIPFEETRDYVKKVLSNTMYYASQFNAPLRPLKMRLGIVPGKTEDSLQTIMPFIPAEAPSTELRTGFDAVHDRPAEP
ncbi:MAG: transglycosylase SLT domain-containing protein [Gallionella sp.]